MATFICDFHALEPAHLAKQSTTLKWLAAAHSRAEATHAALAGDEFDEIAFRNRIQRAFTRFGCSEENIASRGYEIPDCDHTNWSEMRVYRLEDNPRGVGAGNRSQVFHEAAKHAFRRFLPEGEPAPSDLLHVTCTGYVAPSAAQELVAERRWSTRVIHAYHMGCYAALPAVRIAAGLLEPVDGDGTSPPRVRLVHTELCSLHIDPLNHEPEQLVVQSLFSDGLIAYSVVNRLPPRSMAFELMALHEQIVPDSSRAMAWVCSDFGMQMALSRGVPELIARELGSFLERLRQSAGLTRSEMRGASYAVHPGGPKILDLVAQVLELENSQLAHSRKVLRERGNMSSATLPHVWQELLSDERVLNGKWVVSLAFGPGLTIYGAVVRKVSS